MARDTKTVASNILSATTALLKWAGVTSAISGLLGAGGLYGIDRLAISAGNQRRAALGLGVTPGERSSFQVNYGRLFDPDQFLGGVNEALHDITKRVGLYGAGLSEGDIRGKDAAQVSQLLIPALKRLADQTPENMLAQVLQARHLDQFVTLEDFQRLRRTPQAEVGQYAQQYQADIKALDLTRDQARIWQDLQVQLHRAGREIETVLIVGLTKVAGPLGHLSESFVHVVDAFAKSDAVKGWVDSLASGLETFAKFIGTPEFKADVEGFVNGLAEAGRAIAGFISSFGSPRGTPDAPQPPSPGEPAPAVGGWGFDSHLHWGYQSGGTDEKPRPAPAPWHFPGSRSASPDYMPGGSGYNPIAFRVPLNDKVAEAHDFFRTAGWSEAQTAGLLSNLNAESGFNPRAINASGHQGIAQWDKARSALFRQLFGHDPSRGTFEEQLLFVQYELEHNEKAAGDRLRRAMTPAQAGAAVNEGYERSGTNSAVRAAGAGQYANQFKDRSVTVKVENNTGGNANISIAQLAV